MRNLIEQLAKFGIVGVIAFVIDYGVMLLLAELFGVHPVIAATVSFCISVTFNYLASMEYVFTRKQGMGRKKELAIFIVLSVAGLLINDVIMLLGTGYLSIDYRIVKLVATALVMIWNFALPSSFLRTFRQPYRPAFRYGYSSSSVTSR